MLFSLPNVEPDEVQYFFLLQTVMFQLFFNVFYGQPRLNGCI